ncbi:hypothetical protein GlitD10_2302, partial [Gloeomargarita lithophora Alchichica-D10]
ISAKSMGRFTCVRMRCGNIWGGFHYSKKGVQNFILQR